MERAELRGGEGEGLHGLAVHVHQPHHHRLVGQQARAAGLVFRQDSLEVHGLTRPVNGPVGEEKRAALGGRLGISIGPVVAVYASEPERIAPAPQLHRKQLLDIAFAPVVVGQWQRHQALGIGRQHGTWPGIISIWLLFGYPVGGLRQHPGQHLAGLAVQHQQLGGASGYFVSMHGTQVAGREKGIAGCRPGALPGRAGILVAQHNQVMAGRQRCPGRRQLQRLVQRGRFGQGHRPGGHGPAF